jgi:hypothetical protein
LRSFVGSAIACKALGFASDSEYLYFVYLESPAFGHEHAASFGVLRELHCLQLVLQALGLACHALHLHQASSELLLHGRVQQKLSNLRSHSVRTKLRDQVL